jgi:hypothetical protein
MKDNLKDILSHLGKNIDQETLLLYLQGKLSPEQQHEVEKNLMDGDFETEALEGLQTVEDQKALPHIVEQLNRNLKKKTTRKKIWKKAPELKDDPWLWIAILIILLLIVICYVVIHKHLQEG